MWYAAPQTRSVGSCWETSADCCWLAWMSWNAYVVSQRLPVCAVDEGYDATGRFGRAAVVLAGKLSDV